MPADERTLFREAMDAVLTRNPGESAMAVLHDEGFDEVRAEDETFALSTLFEAAGRHLSSAPLLDLVLAPTVTGVRPVVRRLDAADDSAVDLVALGAPDDDDLLVLPDSDDGAALRIPVGGLRVEAVEGIDPDLGMHRYRGELTDPASYAVDELDVPPARSLLRRCIGHELVGVAERAARVAREHVLTREQFGRALGTWQTVQHRLADVQVEIMAARAALEAAWGDPQPVVTAAARSQAAGAATGACDAAQQLLGAIGFTWEHDIHLAVRRARVLETAFGSPAELADEIAGRLLAATDWNPLDVHF